MPTNFAPFIPDFLGDPATMHAPRAGWVRLEGLDLAADGSSIDITAGLTVALSTAGRNSSSVPLQPSPNFDSPGVIVEAGADVVLVFDGVIGAKLTNATTGNEVFGKVSEAGGVFTVDFFTKDASGSDAAETVSAIADLDLEIPYLFPLAQYPAYGDIAVKARNVSQDPSGGGSTISTPLVATAQNTFPNIAGAIASTGMIAVIYRGKYHPAGNAGELFNIDRTTGAVTILPATPFNIEAGETITALYPSV